MVFQGADITNGTYLFHGKQSTAMPPDATARAGVLSLLARKVPRNATPRSSQSSANSTPSDDARSTVHDPHCLPQDIIYQIMRRILRRAASIGRVLTNYTMLIEKQPRGSAKQFWQALVRLLAIGPRWQEVYRHLVPECTAIREADLLVLNPNTIAKGIIMDCHAVMASSSHLMAVTKKCLWNRAIIGTGSCCLMLYMPVNLGAEMELYGKTFSMPSRENKGAQRRSAWSLYYPTENSVAKFDCRVTDHESLGRTQTVHCNDGLLLPFDLVHAYMSSSRTQASEWREQRDMICPGDVVSFSPCNDMRLVLAIDSVTNLHEDAILAPAGCVVTEQDVWTGTRQVKERVYTPIENITSFHRVGSASMFTSELGIHFVEGQYKLLARRNAKLGDFPVLRIDRINRTSVMATVHASVTLLDHTGQRVFVDDLTSFDSASFTDAWEAERFARRKRARLHGVLRREIVPGDLVLFIDSDLSKPRSKSSYVHSSFGSKLTLTDGQIVRKSSVVDVIRAKEVRDGLQLIHAGHPVAIRKGNMLCYRLVGSRAEYLSCVIYVFEQGVVVEELHSAVAKFYLYDSISIQPM